MKMQAIHLPSDNALRCRALAQENAALRAAALSQYLEEE